jgi:hypothetical protein
MELTEQVVSQAHAQLPGLPETATESAERAARRTLRRQITKLERELSDAFVTAFPMGGLDAPPQRWESPRLLDLGELERVRDELAERLHAARTMISERAELQEANRVALERMLLAPEEHRFEVMPLRELGEPGCGLYAVRPRVGLIGMLRGWWEVKLSSGCPLPRGRAHRARPAQRPLLRRGPKSSSTAP